MVDDDRLGARLRGVRSLVHHLRRLRDVFDTTMEDRDGRITERTCLRERAIDARLAAARERRDREVPSLRARAFAVRDRRPRNRADALAALFDDDARLPRVHVVT